jgi:hypothetical protein
MFSSFFTKQKKLPPQVNIPKLDPIKSRPIPTTFNYVWFGGEIPNTIEHPYLDNLINTADKFGKTYKIKLWISRKHYAKGDISKRKRLETLCKEHNIEIHDIDLPKYQNLPNRKLAYKLIEMKMNPEWQPNKKMNHFVAAADVIKAAVTYKYGGHTIDFDLLPKKNIKLAKYGVLFDCGDKQSTGVSRNDDNTFKVSQRFHYLAACPQHELLYIITLLHKYNLEYIFDQKTSIAQNVCWAWHWQSNKHEFHDFTVIATGKLIPKAMKILEKIDPNWHMLMNYPTQFSLNTAIFIPEYFDITDKHSWTDKLSGNPPRHLFLQTAEFSSKLEQNAYIRFRQGTGINLQPHKDPLIQQPQQKPH